MGSWKIKEICSQDVYCEIVDEDEKVVAIIPTVSCDSSGERELEAAARKERQIAAMVVNLVNLFGHKL